MSGKPLYLIGYEKSGLAEFLATLGAAGVKTLVDVRDLPLSRRAGFSKRQLQAAVEAAGMRYVHLRALGTSTTVATPAAPSVARNSARPAFS